MPVSDLDGTPAGKWLAEQRRKKIGPQTHNYYVAALIGFGNWLVKARRIPENPFRFLERQTVDVDVRHVRRTLTAEEMDRLLRAAGSGTTFGKLSGPLRRWLYLVSSMTGLRASELASLTTGSLHLDDDPPRVVLQAKISKHRKRDTVPLHPDLVIELRNWFREREADSLLWPGKWAKHNGAGDMIRHDLALARRSWLAEAKELARHS